MLNKNNCKLIILWSKESALYACRSFNNNFHIILSFFYQFGILINLKKKKKKIKISKKKIKWEM